MEKMTPGGCLSLPHGYIHVYDHHFQRYFSLKPLGQFIAPNFHGKGGKNVYINSPVNMTKMASMPIYGKNLKKSSPTEPGVL